MSAPEPANPTDPRVARSRRAVLEATSELLAEVGFAGLSIDAISKRSGVARTTIYRHWPSLGTLVYDAAVSASPTPELTETDDVWHDISVFVHGLAHRLAHEEWGKTLPSLVDAANRDVELRTLLIDKSLARRTLLRQLIERAQAEGSVRSDVDPAVLTEMLSGPIFTRRLVSYRSLEPDEVQVLIDACRDFAAPRWTTRRI